MKNTYNLRNLKPGDRLVFPKGMIQHHAIYIGNDAYGNRVYIENHINHGVTAVSETYLFRDGYHITRIEPFIGSNIQRNEAVKRAKQLIGKPYNLINFNCEHYANTVQHNRSYSKQVGAGVVAVVTIALLSIGLSK